MWTHWNWNPNVRLPVKSRSFWGFANSVSLILWYFWQSDALYSSHHCSVISQCRYAPSFPFLHFQLQILNFMSVGTYVGFIWRVSVHGRCITERPSTLWSHPYYVHACQIPTWSHVFKTGKEEWDKSVDKLKIFDRLIHFPHTVGSIETCSHLHDDSICMSRRFMDDKIIFLHVDFIPIDVGRHDWYTKIIGLPIHTTRIENSGWYYAWDVEAGGCWRHAQFRRGWSK